MEHQGAEIESRNIRRQNVEHVLATSRLSGIKPSALISKLFRRYQAGEISSSQVVEALREHYKLPAQPPSI